jgi:hypothetical protein
MAAICLLMAAMTAGMLALYKIIAVISRKAGIFQMLKGALLPFFYGMINQFKKISLPVNKV